MTVVNTMPSGPGLFEALIATGFNDFEIHVPYHLTSDRYECCYSVAVSQAEAGRWVAEAFDVVAGAMVPVIPDKATGDTPGEALWRLTSVVDDRPWQGDVSALPARIKALVAVLFAEAVMQVADAAARKYHKAEDEYELEDSRAMEAVKASQKLVAAAQEAA